MQFYLLVGSDTSRPGSLPAGGRHWHIEAYTLDQNPVEQLTYICISYTWGEGRETSPMHTSFDISDRTLPALEVVARLRPNHQRIWIDALCIPQEFNERVHNLESMGYIYSQAEEVIAVLSTATYPVLTCMAQRQPLLNSHLEILENEDWVSRAWTYQEAINARTLFFTCEGSVNPLILADQLLSDIGYAISKLKMPRLEVRQHHPRLDAFEDLCDYLTAGYEERSALQIMAKMDLRTQQYPEDHFYAMIGAVSKARASTTDISDPCESFMRLCEQKGDYSFIFSAAPRDDTPGRRWRPAVSETLPAILPWHCEGAGQPGRHDANGLVLEQIMTAPLGPLWQTANEFISTWLASIDHPPGKSSWTTQDLFTALKLMGFQGSRVPLTCLQGLFYPSEDIAPESVKTILVSTSIRWQFGAPGIACCTGSMGSSYSPGVFVGIVPIIQDVKIG